MIAGKHNQTNKQKPQSFCAEGQSLCLPASADIAVIEGLCFLTQKYVNYRYLIKSAIKDKILIKPKCCFLCKREVSKINAHHPDYNKPYEVVWLCNRCHIRLHYGLPYDYVKSQKPKKLRGDQTTVFIKGKQYTLPILKKEPYQLKGLICEKNVLDTHQRNKRNVESIRWDKLLNNLSSRERDIIKLRYGIGNDTAYASKEIGKIFNLSYQRICQIEAKAIRKLHNMIKKIEP